jgi:signal transduction histidine kinase
VLNNAIKYSTIDSTIKIDIETHNDQIVCSIKDQCIGIKEDDLKHIYKNFYRSNALDHKHISGQGLGLSIVKKCADAINAQLNINSEIGKGTTVTISF